jgi:hypothetical protein|tara:strand:+ start:6581 stop:6970 length:390 start_codon:yes stop_codon:yes gene_type:complete
MGLFDFISNIFSPAAKIVDELHTSDEEKLKLKNELANIQGKAQDRILDYESKLAEYRHKLLIAEANSPHPFVAMWRPICSTALVTIIVLASFGLCQPGPELYKLAEIFLGAYVGGRTIEKIVSASKLGK